MVTYNETSKRKEKTPVFYHPKNELNQYKKRCKFCTHWQYFDYKHLNEASEPYPHDHPQDHYMKPDEIEHHGDHCPDIHGNINQKIKYHFKRVELGMSDPYYNGSVAIRELEKRRKEVEAKEKADKAQETPLVQEKKPDTIVLPQTDVRQTIPSESNQLSLLHKRVDKRKAEIHQLQDIVYDLIQVVQAHTESTTIPQELNRLLSSMREVKAVLANEKLDKYVTK